MKVLVIRSPHLVYSRETINGYRYPSCGTDVRLYRRRHSLADISRLRRVLQLGSYTHVLDLSCSYTFDNLDGIPVYNSPAVKSAVPTPGDLRRTMPESLPPRPDIGSPAWLKGPGEGGVGKTFHPSWALGNENLNHLEDAQVHIEGTEYRINTVADKVVQVHTKGNRDSNGNRNKFDYTWVGLDAIRTGGFIPLIKESVRSIPSWSNSVLAWDIIHDGERPYVIEINTSPGMNQATASRIYRSME
jgi:hypothetical protein